ncbi:DUF7220 family protein [Cereibacter sphaeroides]|jgi:hypothetical protein|uniref:DUF7220 family protein n=1 Tax=Cereibacter sphaeroides TaxID=1063 RepID=UPI0000F29EBD|nr:hypothetical protein Rsph17029_0652 [Cereibacter sphaeroides ATCC 17029]
MQGRVMSGVEAVTNVVVGYGVSVVATMIILPAFGVSVDPGEAFGISAAFTVVSLARSYLLRRLFSRWG